GLEAGKYRHCYRIAVIQLIYDSCGIHDRESDGPYRAPAQGRGDCHVRDLRSRQVRDEHGGIDLALAGIDYRDDVESRGQAIKLHEGIRRPAIDPDGIWCRAASGGPDVDRAVLPAAVGGLYEHVGDRRFSRLI